MQQVPDWLAPYASVNANGCWIWSRSIGSSGYGQKRVLGKYTLKAHRWVYEQIVGPIPAGKILCHHCDVKTCVNPSHIFVGTHRENSLDAVAKGLKIGGPSRISDEQCREIRALYNTGIVYREIAKRYGISRGWVKAIMVGRGRQRALVQAGDGR